MTECQGSRRATHRTLRSGALLCLGLVVVGTLVVMGAPGAATAFAAPSVPRSGDPLARLAIQQNQLDDPLAATGDAFGWSVALSGDTALVSAWGKTTKGHKHAGAVYVFVRAGAIWSQQAKLTALDAASDDNFGSSVALSGDTALIGAENKTVDGHKLAGAAYVFVRSGTTWSQQAKLSDPDAGTDNLFGLAVALSGDTTIVGAPGKTVNGHNSAGAAYVFVRPGTSWSQQAKLSDPDAAAGDSFGVSVALSGDEAVVGTGKFVGSHSDAGAAYVFIRTGTTWSQQAELGGATAGSNFSGSVALSGDTAIIGAPGKAVNGHTEAGTAYVYARTGTTWARQAEVTASDAAKGDVLGSSAALDGDTALVGAWGKTVSGHSGAGAVYVVSVTPAPSLTAALPAVKAGKRLALSGVVGSFLATDTTVRIERKVGSKLTLLKTLPLNTSGAFKWAMKPNKAGKWVFEVAYKVGKVIYLSKPVTVKVHK